MIITVRTIKIQKKPNEISLLQIAFQEQLFETIKKPILCPFVWLKREKTD